MRTWYRAAGESSSSTDADVLGGGGTNAFRVDASIGHAWFARPAEPPQVPVARGPRMLPVLRRAELILSGQGRAVARRATRIPADAIVALGAALSPVSREPSPPAAVANDNARRLSPRVRTFLREVLFLLIFGATLAGTYYLGRLQAAHNVIVVPDSGSARSKIV